MVATSCGDHSNFLPAQQVEKLTDHEEEKKGLEHKINPEYLKYKEIPMTRKQ